MAEEFVNFFAVKKEPVTPEEEREKQEFINYLAAEKAETQALRREKLIQEYPKPKAEIRAGPELREAPRAKRREEFINYLSKPLAEKTPLEAYEQTFGYTADVAGEAVRTALKRPTIPGTKTPIIPSPVRSLLGLSTEFGIRLPEAAVVIPATISAAVAGGTAIGLTKAYQKYYLKNFGPKLWATIKGAFYKHMPEEIRRGLIYGYGKPEKAKAAFDRLLAKKATGFEKGVAYGEMLKQLTRQEQREVGWFLKGFQVSPEEEYVSKLTTKEFGKIANPIRKNFMDLAREARRLGLLSDESFFKHHGQYMPRMYEAFEGGAKQYESMLRRTKLKRPPQIDINRWLNKKDLPLELRKRLGEIEEAFLPVVKGTIQEEEAVATSKYFHQLSRNPRWVSETPRAIRPVEGWEAIGERVVEGKRKIPVEARKFVKMPDKPEFGALRGKYINPYIADDVRVVKSFVEKEHKPFLDSMTGLYRTGLGAWRYGKVLLGGPAPYVRNMMSNKILNDMGGLGIHRVDIYGKGLRDLAKGGKYTQRINKVSNLLRGTYAREEVGTLLESYRKARGETALTKGLATGEGFLRSSKFGAKGMIFSPANVYQAIEKWDKISRVIWLTEEKGMSLNAAIKNTEKYLFNYQKIPPFIKFYRNWWAGHPFITFDYKALPLAAETLAKTPHRLLKYPIMFNAVERYGASRQGIPYEQVLEERETLPDYMKAGLRNEMLGIDADAPWVTRYRQLRLPYKDKQGRSLYMDLQYILPWGSIYNLGGVIGEHPAMFWLEMKANRSMFTGRQIVPDGAKDEERKRLLGEFLMNKFLPPITPRIGDIPGGYTWEFVRKAARGEPAGARQEDIIEMKHAILRLVGIKVKPISMDINQKFDRYKESLEEKGRKRRAARERKKERIRKPIKLETE